MLNLIKLMVAVAIASFSVSASAYVTSQVGELDNLLAAETLKNSGEATEEAWIESILGTDIDYTQFGSISEGDNWQSVTDGISGDYAFDFGIDFLPEHYLLKLGSGNGTGVEFSHYLFENLDSLQYAYVNLEMFGEGVRLENIGIVSHIGSSGGCEGDCETVPEPGMVGLLAIGLLGMVARRRFKI